MNQTFKTILISVITFIVLLFGLAIFSPVPTTPLGAGEALNRMTGSVTNDKEALSTTSEIVLAANGSRQYALLTNTDGSIDITLSLGETAVADEGIVLEAGESYEIKPGNLYVGAIHAIADSGTPTLAIVEK